MDKSWTDIAIVLFPWIGGGAAVVLLILLFGTRLLQSEPGSSRWHDRVWLSWLAVAIYLLHNVEEYGIDVFGRMTQFPAEICSVSKLPVPPNCPIPAAYFLAVNIPLIRVIAPMAALLARRHPLVGLAFYGVIFVNLFFHIMPLLTGLASAPARLPQSFCSYRYRLGSSTPASEPDGRATSLWRSFSSMAFSSTSS